MEDTLGMSFLDQGDGLRQGLLSPLHVFLFKSHPYLLDMRCDGGFDVNVSEPSFLILPGPFDR